MSDDLVEIAANVLGEAATGLDSIPLPPEIKKSVFKALGNLLTGLADVPAAWLESRAQGIRADTAAQSAVTKRAGEVAAARLSTDPALINRATAHFTARLAREQINRESIAKGTIEELRLNPPTEDAPAQLDTDWLDMFGRLAEQRSSAEMQRYFARLLAGELRKPGSFSAKTMQILSTLSPGIALLFTNFCDIAFVIPELAAAWAPQVIAAPFGPPSANSLRPVGLPYIQLLKLQEAGLIASDLTSWHNFASPLFVGTREVGGQQVTFAPRPDSTGDTAQITRAGVLLLTQAGHELFALVDRKPNATYLEKFIPWVETTFSLVHVTQ